MAEWKLIFTRFIFGVVLLGDPQHRTYFCLGQIMINTNLIQQLHHTFHCNTL